MNSIYSLISLFVMCIMVFLIAPQPLPASRACCEGDMWLKWAADQREAYVQGFTLGYSSAFGRACNFARNIPQAPPRSTESTDPVAACRKMIPDFSRGTKLLVEDITQFYNLYPKDRDLYVDEVLVQLGQNQSLQQIHERPFSAHTKN